MNGTCQACVAMVASRNLDSGKSYDFPPILSTSSYHHGDLRRAVLDGALAAIAADGAAALSLREVARGAGVSHAAPAHHFGDKKGVLTAIAREGFELLADTTRRTMEQTGDLVEGGL